MKDFSSTATCPVFPGAGSPHMHHGQPIGAHMKNTFIGKVVKHWHKLPGGVVEYLETFKTCVNKFLSNPLLSWPCFEQQGLVLGDLQRSLQASNLL